MHCNKNMDEIIKQYGEMIISVVGCISFLVVIGSKLLANDGVLAKLICLWGIGG